MIDDKYVTIREASIITGKTVRTIRYWIQIGKIKAVKDSNGYRWIICKDDLEGQNADQYR